MIIDEKGRLFGLINLIDLMVVIAVLIAVYIGITLIIVSRQPPLTVESIEPAVVENSLSQTVTVHLKNYRRLVNGTVTLLPHTGTSGSKSFPLIIHRFDREKATFQISNIDPGTYHLKFDIETKDVLRRVHQTSQIIESALTVEGWDAIPGLNEKNLQIELQLLVDKANPIVSDSIKTGDRLKIDELGVDVTVLDKNIPGSNIEKVKNAIVTGDDSISTENKLLLTLAGRMSYINLSNLINYYLSVNKPLELLKGENRISADAVLIRERTTREITNRIRLELPFIFMAVKPSQLEEIQNNRTIINSDGSIKAEIKTIDGYQFPDQDKQSDLNEKLIAAANKIVDMYLTVSVFCVLKDDGLYFDGKPLNENNLYSFKFGETTIYGKLKSQRNTARVIGAKIRTENISNSLLDLVYDGLPIMGKESKQVVGEIKKVLDKDTAASELFEFGELKGLFKSAIFAVNLYTEVSSSGIQLPDGQPLTLDNDLSLNLLSQPVAFKLQFQTQSKTIWKEFRVEFRNLDESMLKYIQEGQRNIGESGILIKNILKKDKSSRLEAELSDGKIIMTPVSGLYNIQCDVDMQVTRDGSKYLYNGKPVIIGQEIDFSTDKINVQFKIRNF